MDENLWQVVPWIKILANYSLHQNKEYIGKNNQG
jgi:hypothetical protein